MKVKTALQNIEAEKQRHDLALQQLTMELEESIDTTINKARSSLINKFAKTFSIAPEVVEKKILPKSKRQCDAIKLEEMRNIHENQAIMYNPVTHNNKTYFCQDKVGGIVIEKDDSGRVKIVGYMANDKIIFATVSNNVV